MTVREKEPWTPLAEQTYTPLSSTLAPGMVSTPRSQEEYGGGGIL